MKENLVARLSEVSIAHRLAVLIFFILLTIVFVDILSQELTTMPDIYLFEKRWLIQHLVDTKTFFDEKPEAEWGAVLKDYNENNLWFDISITAKIDFTTVQEYQTDTFKDFQSGLQALVDQDPPPIVNATTPFASVSRRLTPVTVIARKVPSRLVDELEDKGKGDISISTNFSVSMPLRNGDWLIFQTKKAPIPFQAYVRVLMAPIFGIAMILMVSIWTSRSLLKPLQQLSRAAEILGRERSISAIPCMHIPEYKNIANAFMNTQVQLKRFVDERTHMLAAISHDLRTQLTRMLLLIDDINDEQKKRDLAFNISNMESMIREYLVFASENAREEAYVQTDIASLMLSICNTLQDTGSDVVYEGPDRMRLNCQPVAMRRMFLNIIENGCQYGSSVVVTLSEANGFIKVLAKDKGPGIPDHLMEQAFQPFKRLETSRNRDMGGTGLGLSIVKDIIAAHGGEIHLVNAKEGGLEVTILLPKSRQLAT